MKEKLTDLCLLITKGTTPSTIGESFTNKGIIYIKSDALCGNRRLNKECFTYISNDTHEKLKRSQIKKNDILFSIAGALLGKTSIVMDGDYPSNTNQAVAIIRANPEKIDYMYLYYFLSQKEIQNYVRNINSQSAQPNVNLQQVGNIEINFPSKIEIQKAISEILSRYDEKIELNSQYICTLNCLLESIYENLFYKSIYDSNLHEWNERSVFDCVHEIKIKNKDEKDYPVLSVVKEGEFKPSEDVFTKQVYSKSTKNYKIVRRNQVAYNPARANIGSIAMLKEYDVGIVSPIYTVFEMKDTITPTFFYYYMKQPIFQEMIKHHAIGTTRQNFPFEAFKMFPMVVPPMELQLKFEEIAKPIEQKIAKIKEENEVLAEIRDTLLPKLMSGELPVEVGDK